MFDIPGYENRWARFYESIKDPSWPDCPTETEFNRLPLVIQQEILLVHEGQRYLEVDPASIEHEPTVFTTKHNKDTNTDMCFDSVFNAGSDVKVYYNTLLASGGDWTGQNYPRLLRYLYPDRHFVSCMEWCAGPGFIGFRLLADALCDQVYLMDVYAPAMAACQKTIAHLPPALQTRAHTLHTGDVAAIDSNIKFDLIVGNPPHYNRSYTKQTAWNSLSNMENVNRLWYDDDWQVHENFFQHIKKNLADDGVILLQEHAWGSDSTCFHDMAVANQLKIVRSFRERHNLKNYYLELAHL